MAGVWAKSKSEHFELKYAVPDHAPSLKNIYKWIAEFKRNSNRLQDKPRSRQPITESLLSNIDLVRTRDL